MKKNILFLSLPLLSPMKEKYQTNFQLIQYYFLSLLKANIINKNFFNLIFISENEISSLNNNGIINLIKEKNPDIVLFSCYLWNIERNLYISSYIKNKLNKNILTVAGGPEIKDDNHFLNTSFLNNQYFDLYFDSDYLYDFVLFFNNINEILQIIEKNKQRKNPIFYSQLKNLNFPKAKLNEKLEKYVFNRLVNNLKEFDFNSKIVLFEIQRGCIQKCEYCQYAKSSYNQVSVDSNEIKDYIDTLIKNNKKLKEIYFLAPTLNANRELYNNLINYFIKQLSSKIISKNKNIVFKNQKIKLFGELNPFLIKDEKEIEKLKLAGFNEIEIGVQSLKRISSENLKKLKNLFYYFKKYEIKPIIDFIVGLPEEGYDDWVYTCNFLEDFKMLKYANFYHLLILPSISLKKRFEQKGFIYLKEPPYYAIETDKYDLNTIKKFYSYLEFEKNFSYFESFDKKKNTYFFKIENFNKDLDKYNLLFQNLNKINLAIFYKNNDKNEINKFLNFLKFFYEIIENNKETFIKLYFYIDSKINLSTIYKILLDFKKSLFPLKNYYDKFHESINFDNEIFSKSITILGNLENIDKILNIFYIDFEIGLYIEHLENIENKLRQGKDIYNEYNFYTFIDENFIKNSKSENINEKEVLKELRKIDFIKFL